MTAKKVHRKAIDLTEYLGNDQITKKIYEVQLIHSLVSGEKLTMVNSEDKYVYVGSLYRHYRPIYDFLKKKPVVSTVFRTLLDIYVHKYTEIVNRDTYNTKQEIKNRPVITVSKNRIRTLIIEKYGNGVNCPRGFSIFNIDRALKILQYIGLIEGVSVDEVLDKSLITFNRNKNNTYHSNIFRLPEYTEPHTKLICERCKEVNKGLVTDSRILAIVNEKKLNIMYKQSDIEQIKDTDYHRDMQLFYSKCIAKAKQRLCKKGFFTVESLVKNIELPKRDKKGNIQRMYTTKEKEKLLMLEDYLCTIISGKKVNTKSLHYKKFTKNINKNILYIIIKGDV